MVAGSAWRREVITPDPRSTPEFGVRFKLECEPLDFGRGPRVLGAPDSSSLGHLVRHLRRMHLIAWG
jgi:hypothetical protein